MVEGALGGGGTGVLEPDLRFLLWVGGEEALTVDVVSDWVEGVWRGVGVVEVLTAGGPGLVVERVRVVGEAGLQVAGVGVACFLRIWA